MVSADVLAILETLIGFDTTSRNSNLALIAWVENFLSRRGVESRRVVSADGAKANLLAIVGPAVEGGVVLSGHSDVVPVDGQDWSSDPWKATEREGKLFGRGVADMKTFLALALAHVDAALAAPLRRPLILAFSYDEEVGCLGAPDLIAALGAAAPKPAAVIVGEPTSMKVVSGHKGICTFSVEVQGREAHSSQPALGVSAIMEALPLMQRIAEMAEQAAAKADPASGFSPPGATLTIGKLNGGTAGNILARRCEFLWDLRCPPGDDPEVYAQAFLEHAGRLDAAIKRRAPEGGVRVTRRSTTPAMAQDHASAAETLVRSLTGDNGVAVASYAAEAGLFQQAGFPVVLCGPGSIEQAHQPDEWIALEQVEAGAIFMRKLIARLAA